MSRRSSRLQAISHEAPQSSPARRKAWSTWPSATRASINRRGPADLAPPKRNRGLSSRREAWRPRACSGRPLPRGRSNGPRRSPRFQGPLPRGRAAGGDPKHWALRVLSWRRAWTTAPSRKQDRPRPKEASPVQSRMADSLGTGKRGMSCSFLPGLSKGTFRPGAEGNENFQDRLNSKKSTYHAFFKEATCKSLAPCAGKNLRLPRTKEEIPFTKEALCRNIRDRELAPDDLPR